MNYIDILRRVCYTESGGEQMNSDDNLLIRYTDINRPIQAREDAYGPVPLHWHSYYEVELITDGNPLQLINGSVRAMKPGMISIMTPRDFHRYTGESRIKKFIFKENCIQDDIARLLLTRQEPCVIDTGSRFAWFSERIDTIISQFRDEDIYCSLRLRNIVEAICIEILSADRVGPEEQSADPSSAQYHNILTYIDEHFREPISLSDAAAAVHLSPNYFSHWFSRTLGTTYSQYVQFRRIQYASALLLSTRLSVEEIAWQTGYGSLSFFNRVFRRQYSMSPLAYRERFSVPRRE